MRAEFSKMPGKDMVQVVNDMQWLAQFADSLEKPPEQPFKVVSQGPIKDDKPKATPKKIGSKKK